MSGSVGEAANLGNLAAVHWHSGRLDEAQACYERSLDISRQIGYHHGISAALTGLGVIYRRKGEYAKALAYHEEALQRDRQAGNRQGEVADLGNLGNVYQSAGQIEKASEHLSQALDRAGALGLPLAKMRTLFARGLTREKARCFEAAVDDYRAAVAVVEEMRGRLIEEPQRIDFLADRLAPYRRLTLLLSHHLARPAQALEYVERARSRTFLDLLERAGLHASPEAGTGEPLRFQELIGLLD